MQNYVVQIYMIVPNHVDQEICTMQIHFIQGLAVGLFSLVCPKQFLSDFLWSDCRRCALILLESSSKMFRRSKKKKRVESLSKV